MVEYNGFSEPFSAVHGLLVTDLAFTQFLSGLIWLVAPVVLPAPAAGRQALGLWRISFSTC